MDYTDQVTLDYTDQVTMDYTDQVTIDYTDQVTMDYTDLSLTETLTSADCPSSASRFSSGVMGWVLCRVAP